MATVFRAAAALLMSLLVIAPVRAEPIPVMGGTLATGFNFNDFRATFALTVPGGTVEGSWPRGSVEASTACFGCLAGSTVTPDALWLNPEVPSDIATPFPAGSVVVNGIGGNGPLSGQLLFLGDPFVLPELGDVNEGTTVSLAQPFSFRGSITVYERLETGPFDPAQLISVDLVGLGTARLEFGAERLSSGMLHYVHTQTTYEFAPVPEPLSMLTVGTGLALLLRRRLIRS